jgi:hypothetical protein
MLAILAAAGATTLALMTIKPAAFMTIKPAALEQRAAPAEPVDPAILKEHLRELRGEMVLP